MLDFRDNITSKAWRDGMRMRVGEEGGKDIIPTLHSRYHDPIDNYV
jgi:hypothetical protein